MLLALQAGLRRRLGHRLGGGSRAAAVPPGARDAEPADRRRRLRRRRHQPDAGGRDRSSRRPDQPCPRTNLVAVAPDRLYERLGIGDDFVRVRLEAPELVHTVGLVVADRGAHASLTALWAAAGRRDLIAGHDRAIRKSICLGRPPARKPQAREPGASAAMSAIIQEPRAAGRPLHPGKGERPGGYRPRPAGPARGTRRYPGAAGRSAAGATS